VEVQFVPSFLSTKKSESMAALRLLVFFAALAAVDATSSPIGKVISLLSKLDAQIQREGAKEAKDYDKFACYCKDEATKTLDAIEKSKAKIASQTATLKELDAEIKDTSSDIKDLKKVIAKKTKDTKTSIKKRGKDEKDYVKEADEEADAITATKEAIKAIKGNKKSMTDAKLNLLQDQLLGFLSMSAVPPTAAQLHAVESLTQKPPKSSAKKHAYIYASNGIIAILENLLRDFKTNKKTTNLEEKGSISASERKRQNLQRESRYADKDKTEKDTLLASKTEERNDLQKDMDSEKKAMKADQAFLKEITSECETKAAQWDKRSKVRSDELTAMGEAISQLKNGVKGNYGSNSMAASFLQLRSGGSAATVVAQAAALLHGDAARLHSSTLTGLALKLNMGGGHFKKVVKLIKGLIKKLEDEAKAAASTKKSCDENMKKSVEKRDKNQLEVEDQEATIAMKKAKKAKLTDDVATLTKEVSELSKSVLEATELRDEEKANNQATVLSAKSGKKAVGNAIGALNDFYGAQFLQMEAPKKKGSAKNRDGKSVDKGVDFNKDYKGKQGASKGVIGILETIASDFQRTISKTKSEETSSASEFKEYVKTTKKNIQTKNKLKHEHENAIKKATGDITQAKDDKSDANKLMNTAIEELEKVTAMCMTGEGTFAERKKQREEEIKSLSGAMQSLQAWKEF